MSPVALITGSTGFIGSAVTLRVLEAGYRVRLVIRRADQATKLKQIFAKYADNLEFAIVPDLTVPGCYNGVLDGVEYVLHLASPLPAPGTDDLLTPALEGTKAILNAAAKTTSLKRVVITSSVIALISLGGQRDGLIVKETDSIDRAIDPSIVPTLPPMGQYHASKLAAHKATLDFVQENQPRYSTICLHPVFVFGRSLVQTTAEDLSGTPSMLWQSLNSENPNMSQFLGVHIDDVAEAHLKALEVPNHGDDSDVKGVRSYLLAAERRSWADAMQFVKAQYPDVQWPLSSVDATNYGVDTTRAGKELGITFKGMEEQVRDVVDQQLEFRK